MSTDSTFAAFLVAQGWLSLSDLQEYERLRSDADAAFIALALEAGLLTLTRLHELRTSCPADQSLEEHTENQGLLTKEAVADLRRARDRHLASFETYVRWQQLLPEPLLRDALMRFGERVETPADSGTNARGVLVVDDSAVVRRVLREGLEAEGLRVWEAASGKEALDLARAEHPDLITMDLEMPGLDGFATCERLRRTPETTDIPVVMLTVKDSAENRDRGFDVGAVEFLSKHMAPEQIIAGVLGILRQVHGPKHHRVLIVDDSVFVRHVLDYGLRKSGFATLIARDGRECLRHLDSAAPDLMLLDLRLPDIEGVALLRLIKQHPAHRDLPVIVITVVKDREAIIECIEAGAADYLTKPFDLDELIARAGAYVRLHTSQAALQRQTAQLDHLQSMKDRFYATLTHDLRAPFNAIQAPAEMLNMGTGGELTETQRRLVDMIGDASSNALRLVDDALETFRAESGESVLRTSELDFGQLVDQAVRSVLATDNAQGKVMTVNGHVVDLQKGAPHLGDPIHITLDQGKVVRVLGNVLDNAFKYAGSRVSLTVAATPEGVRVTVADDGPGIPAEELPTIWNLYQQSERAKPGSGLGLAIVHAYVSMHGGTVRCESVEGTGATFTITLPDQAGPA